MNKYQLGLKRLDNLIFADIEANGLLDTATKIHVLSFSNPSDRKPRYTCHYEEIRQIFENPENTLVMHNGLTYDKAVVEKILGIEVKCKIIDTLFLSWYLYPDRHAHGLAAWGEEFGVPKPKVDNWEDAPIEVYIHRCQEDVKIQRMLWDKIHYDLRDLYSSNEEVVKVVEHINFKAMCAAEAEKNRWKLDCVAAHKLAHKLQDQYDVATKELTEVMPAVPVIAWRSPPKNPKKKDGTLSAVGIRWMQLILSIYPDKSMDDIFKIERKIEHIKGYKSPNPGSSQQLKKWLKSLGWKPTSHKWVRNKETEEVKKIEQIKDPQTGLLCSSIELMIPDHPELEVLRDMSIVKHRMGVVGLFLKSVKEDGTVIAGVQGFTNTLRFKHRTCVNIPSSRKQYGEEIRALLVARSGKVLCGADMSSLEDRTKQHYMYKYDREYVEEMSTPDFDPHLDIAVAAGFVTTEQVRLYKAGGPDFLQRKIIGEERSKSKVVNYSALYGVGYATLSRSAGLPEVDAKTLLEAYWARNWSVRKIAEDCTVKDSRGMMWLWNPVSKMWLYLKHDKDRFSTLNQSTGTYCFDRWLYAMLEAGIPAELLAQFHDEVVFELDPEDKGYVESTMKDAVETVNEELKLNRELGCDVAFAQNYAGIH